MVKKNPMARALASPLYKKRIIKSRKLYSRKGSKKEPSSFLEGVS